MAPGTAFSAAPALMRCMSWFCGAPAVILMVTIQYEINEVVTGLFGVVLIGWSLRSLWSCWFSVRRNRALAADEGATEAAGTVPVPVPQVKGGSWIREAG